MQLKDDLKFSRKSGFAVGTTKNLRIQWESFLLFCFFFGFNPLPASTEVVSLYVQFLSRSFKSVDAIKNYVSGIRTMHLLLGISIDINSYLINLTVKGINRLHPRCIRQALPITPAILKQFYSGLDFTSPLDVCFWCLFLFAFFLLARKSNLVLERKSDISGKFLLRKDVTKQADYLLVTFRWSKTIQFGDRLLQIPLIKMNSMLCPVLAYERLISMVPLSGEVPLFSYAKNKAITYSMFQTKLRSLCKNIGLDPQEYSSHSFRRGGATLAFQAGVPADLIQFLGDWRSDAYKKYLKFNLDDKLRVVEKMAEYLI